jgi:DNA-binding CsgD family transcriptional regulator
MFPALCFAIENLIPVGLWFAMAYMLFFKLHRPPTAIRRWALLILMGAMALCNQFVLNRLVYRVISLVSFYAIVYAVFIVFALLCGNLRRSLLTVIYFNAAGILIDYTSQFAGFVISGSNNWQEVFFSPAVQVGLRIGTMAVGVLWVVFYCRISKKYPINLPLRLWVLSALPPVISICALIYLHDAAISILETGTNIFGVGLVVGIFLFLLNCISFYWHISLLMSRDTEAILRQFHEPSAPVAMPTSGTALAPAVWTREAGLSEEFATRYDLSPREKQAMELLLEGNSDKVIAAEMNIAISTVSSYLQRLYHKTHVSGRFDLLTLVHTGKSLTNSG